MQLAVNKYWIKSGHEIFYLKVRTVHFYETVPSNKSVIFT